MDNTDKKLIIQNKDTDNDANNKNNKNTDNTNRNEHSLGNDDNHDQNKQVPELTDVTEIKGKSLEDLHQSGQKRKLTEHTIKLEKQMENKCVKKQMLALSEKDEYNTAIHLTEFNIHMNKIQTDLISFNKVIHCSDSEL